MHFNTFYLQQCGSILGPSSLKNRFRALKPSAFERELNFKKSSAIYGNPSPVTP